MSGQSIKQRIIEHLESLKAQQRREALALLENLAPPAADSKAKTPRRVRQRKTPGEIFWERLVNEGLYDGDGRQQH